MKKTFLYWIGGILFLFLLGLILNRYFFAGWAIRMVDRVDVRWMGYTDQKVVALTFDDGPDPRYTPRILAILKRYRIPATFFVIGANVLKNQAILAQEVQDGHEIGDHTFSHPHLSELSREKIMWQIGTTEEKVYKAVGVHTSMFRPPYEEITETILAAARDVHQQIILSTITLEHGGKHNPKQEVERVLKMVFPGAIILAHDGRLNRSTTIEALPKLIEGLKEKGYRIVPLRQLIHN